MNTNRALFCATILLVLGFATAQAVIEVDSSNFDETILTKDIAIVAFYAPWANEYPEFESIYEEVGLHFGDRLFLAKVDATKNAELAKKYPLKGYPTILIFRKGRFVVHEGRRGKGDFLEDFEKLFERSARYMPDSFTTLNFSNSAKVVVIGVFEDVTSPEFEAFNDAADYFQGKIPFGYVNETSAASTLEVDSAPIIVLNKRFDEGRVTLNVTLDADTIISFVQNNSVPLIDEINGENYRKFMAQDKPFLFIFLDSSERREKDRTLRMITPIAEELRYKANFVWIDIKTYQDFAKALGLSCEYIPSLVLQMSEPYRRYVMPEDEEFEATFIRQWINDYFEGKLEPFLRSEEIPEESEDLIKKIVGKTYHPVAQDTTKDVLIQICTPSNSQCKRFTSVYEKLAETLKDVDSIVLGYMDSAENDAYGVQVKAQPQLMFYPSNNKDKPITFDDRRTVPSIVQFLRENAGIPFQVEVEPEEEEKPNMGGGWVPMGSLGGDHGDESEREHENAPASTEEEGVVEVTADSSKVKVITLSDDDLENNIDIVDDDADYYDDAEEDWEEDEKEISKEIERPAHDEL
eukprot:TRINITY_DN15843_c0_g1_i1.p1 TRINITY_DN15843_c0_g1~~TRINITY_DN15843_c0_g1_i1.p1  ORF type:complete len:578 (+),score=158.20 TRINITY_DN15843_c0_g1_i1:38-1771(+)